MREGWNRATPQIELTGKQLTKLVEPVFPHGHVENWAHTEGGLANTNIQVRISGVETPYLVRIFERDPKQAEKEYRLSQLVKNKVPGSSAIYFSQTNEITGHPYLIRQWVKGQRLETCIKTAAGEQIKQMGRSVGAALSDIHSITFARAGFFDTNLTVTQEIP